MFTNGIQQPCPVCQKSQDFGYRGCHRLFLYPGPLGDHIRSKHPKWAKRNSGSHWLSRRTSMIPSPLSSGSDKSLLVIPAQQVLRPTFSALVSSLYDPSPEFLSQHRDDIPNFAQLPRSEVIGTEYSKPIVVEDDELVPWPELPTIARHASVLSPSMSVQPEPVMPVLRPRGHERTLSPPSILKRARTLSTRKVPDEIVLVPRDGWASLPSTPHLLRAGTAQDRLPSFSHRRDQVDPELSDGLSTYTVTATPKHPGDKYRPEPHSPTPTPRSHEQDAIQSCNPDRPNLLDEIMELDKVCIEPDFFSTPISGLSPSSTLISLQPDSDPTIVVDELSPKSGPRSPFVSKKEPTLQTQELIERSLSPSESKWSAAAALQSAFRTKPRLPLITTGLPIGRRYSRQALLSRFDLPGGVLRSTSDGSDGWPSHSPDVSAIGTLTPLPPLPSPIPSTPDSDLEIKVPLSAIPELDEPAPLLSPNSASFKSWRLSDSVKIEDIRKEVFPFSVVVEDSPVDSESWPNFDTDEHTVMLQSECLPDMSMQSADYYLSLPALPTATRSPLYCRACGKDPCEEPTATMCGHIFCNRCIVDAVMKSSKCPCCRTPALLYCLFRLDLSV